MFKEYNDNNFIINYPDDLEKLVTNFVSYYKKNIDVLLNKFHLKNIDKMEIKLFSDKSLLGNILYKLGDFAGFFNNKGVNCYINVSGNKGDNYIIKAIMHEIIHHIYRFYIEEEVDSRIVWFDEGLAMNFSLQNDKYKDEDTFKEFLNNRVFSITNIPCINNLKHGSDFVNKNYNGYDLAYLAVKYLIENNSDEDFYLIMKNKKVIRDIGENILDIAINYYYNIYNKK